ncbi:CoB--CoM heterodisulfide reductase iron-sulfur subunit A family protein, partial [candidate division TA06 bacterium]
MPVARDRFGAIKTLRVPRPKQGAVLVVGAGIGGIQASLDLVASGFKVYLVDSKSSIGGTMARLDKTFPTNDCAMCILAPKLVECGRDPNIELITNAEIEDVKGWAGNFSVTLLRRPRYIDPDKCTGCGECANVCPTRAINEFNEGLDARAGIYVRYPQAVPRSFLIDKDVCIGCGLCENICLAKAVNFNDTEEEEAIKVGAILLIPGFSPYDPTPQGEYGYGRYPNVVTSVEFERVLCASGPYGGQILRPSDGMMPKSIAFIQCVGSRDFRSGNDYCSAVCCTYATKEAIIAKEHVRDIEPTIFFMDMRIQVKGGERYYDRAKSEYGVRYVRARVA